jgi:hypothetical protein
VTEGRPVTVVARVHVRARTDEKRYYVVVAFEGGFHKRRAPSAVADVHGHFGCQKKLHDGHVTFGGGTAKGRMALRTFPEGGI